MLLIHVYVKQGQQNIESKVVLTVNFYVSIATLKANYVLKVFDEKMRMHTQKNIDVTRKNKSSTNKR